MLYYNVFNVILSVVTLSSAFIIDKYYNKIELPSNDDSFKNLDKPVNLKPYLFNKCYGNMWLLGSFIIGLTWSSLLFGLDVTMGPEFGTILTQVVKYFVFIGLAYKASESYKLNYLLAFSLGVTVLVDIVVYLHPHSSTSIINIFALISALLASTFKKSGPPHLLHYPDYPHKPEVKPLKVCESTNGSIFDTMFFTYATPIVNLYHKVTDLSIDQLPHIPPFLRARNLLLRIKSILTSNPLPEEDEVSALPLFKNLLRANVYEVSMLVGLSFVIASLYYTPAYFLKLLLTSIEKKMNHEWKLYYAGLLFLSSVVLSLFSSQVWSFATTHFIGRVRSQLNALLFSKTLSRRDVSGANVDETDEINVKSKSQVMTLMTVDADRISQMSVYIFTVVDSPIEIIVGSYFLYSLLGVSALVGLLVIVLFLPLNHFSGKFVVKAQDNLMNARDKRTSLMNEIFGAIRIIKLAGSERKIMSRVHNIRDRELHQQKLNYLIECAFNLIWDSSPFLVSITAIAHYTLWRGLPLTPAIAFTSVSVFNEMQFALNGLPECFIGLLQTFVSIRRIAAYLSSTDISSNNNNTQTNVIISGDSCINLSEATFTWPSVNESHQNFVLKDVNMESQSNSLTLVCGKLGSGKSLFLLGLLGEAELIDGEMRVPRSNYNSMSTFPRVQTWDKWLIDDMVAYSPQVPWLMNASIRDNIIFNHPFDQSRYDQVIGVCGLRSDLNKMDDGDQTEIGEQGLNLSGGQKQRISLARSVYSRARTLLLDDILSAVDSHTADHIFKHCIKGDLMKDRNVILVSHHIQLIGPASNNILAFDNGKVIYSGKSNDFMGSEIHKSLISSVGIDDKEEEKQEYEQQENEDADKNEHKDVEQPQQQLQDQQQSSKAPRKLIQDENKASGSIRKEVYMTLLKNMGGQLYWTLFVLLFVLASVSPMVENWILSLWSKSYVEGSSNRAITIHWISIYGIVILIGVLIGSLRYLVLYLGSIKASHKIHNGMLERVMFAPIRFYDTISRGRLLNRFGKDLEGIDSTLADNFGRSFTNGLSIIASFISVMLVGGIPSVIALSILSVFYYNIGKVFNAASRELRRLDSIYKSPVYSLYSETIAGVATIRAFGSNELRMSEMLEKIDNANVPWYWLWTLSRWLSGRFNFFSSLLIGITALMIVIRGTNASYAGFALAFAMTVSQNLILAVRRLTALEQSMVALERVKEYSENIDREPEEYIEPRPDQNWPSDGEIKFSNFSLSYHKDLPLVLKDINLNIPGKSKVGIVGATGCGKSTLALSFFRFVEPQSGSITIDDIDISNVGLTDLRSRIQIVPQDPTILSGRLRDTLDLYNEFTDEEIYVALKRVHLINEDEEEQENVEPEGENTIKIGENMNVFKDLNTVVDEGGANFSQGQKQLICMARSILKRSKLIIFDEATASVDYKTDELISNAIRSEFEQSTILTIAHRLRSVIDYDYILVMENGHIVEFDRPQALLSYQSKFSNMCKAAGTQEFNILRRIANNNNDNHNDNDNDIGNVNSNDNGNAEGNANGSANGSDSGDENKQSQYSSSSSSTLQL